jgi:hypothetical protein
MFIFCNPTNIFDVDVDHWVFLLADFDEASCSSSLSILATYSLKQFNGRKLTDIMMGQYVMCVWIMAIEL